MTIQLDLSPDEEAVLNRAARVRRVKPEDLLRQLIADLGRQSGDANIGDNLANVPPDNRAALTLLRQWAVEDATDDEDELSRRDAELEELKASMNRTRAEDGRPPAFP